MTEKITKTEAVGLLVSLAKDMEIKDSLDFSDLDIDKNTIYETMANSVIDQMYSVPDEQRETIALATIVKLLVENLVLNINEQRGKNESNTHSD